VILAGNDVIPLRDEPDLDALLDRLAEQALARAVVGV